MQGAEILEPPFGQVVREASLGRGHLIHEDQEEPTLQRLEKAPSRQRTQQVQRPHSRKSPARLVGQPEARMTDSQPAGVRLGRVEGARGGPGPGCARSCREGQEFGFFSKDHAETLEGF